jgi:hypothetical protein
MKTARLLTALLLVAVAALAVALPAGAQCIPETPTNPGPNAVTPATGPDLGWNPATVAAVPAGGSFTSLVAMWMQTPVWSAMTWPAARPARVGSHVMKERKRPALTISR